MIKRWVAGAVLLAVPLMVAATSGAATRAPAETVHLFLKLNGTAVKGESTQSSLGRADSIECTTFKQSVITAREAGSGLATGRRQYQPLVCKKRIDKASPLLMKALSENQVADGEFKFYRPNPTGDGTTEQFYTIKFTGGRVMSYNLETGVGGEEEVVEFSFQKISWTYTNGGVTHEDSWSQQR